MRNDFLAVKTDPQLLHKLYTAHKPTPADILEQRVSFAFSSVKPSSCVTREQVRQVILEQCGWVSASFPRYQRELHKA